MVIKNEVERLEERFDDIIDDEQECVNCQYRSLYSKGAISPYHRHPDGSLKWFCSSYCIRMSVI